MDRTARAAEGGAGAAGIEAEEGAAANGEAGYGSGGRELGGPGEADNVVGGEGDDLVMAASATGVALVREGGAGVHGVVL